MADEPSWPQGVHQQTAIRAIQRRYREMVALLMKLSRGAREIKWRIWPEKSREPLIALRVYGATPVGSQPIELYPKLNAYSPR